MTPENLLDNGNTEFEIDPTKNYYEELVGEGKKYKTQEDLARSKLHADNMISTVLKEKEEIVNDYLKLREEHNAGLKLQELIDRLQEQQLSSRDENLNSNEDKTPAFDPSQIESLVSAKIQEHETSRKSDDNFNQVKKQLIERFGNNYHGVVKEHADRLGLDGDFINNLARKHPGVFFKTLGLEETRQDSFQPPPRSDKRTDTFAPNVPKRTWSYYQKMKRDNPNLYWDGKTQLQKMNDYIDLGKDFEDGDFRVYNNH